MRKFRESHAFFAEVVQGFVDGTGYIGGGSLRLTRCRFVLIRHCQSRKLVPDS